MSRRAATSSSDNMGAPVKATDVGVFVAALGPPAVAWTVGGLVAPGATVVPLTTGVVVEVGVVVETVGDVVVVVVVVVVAALVTVTEMICWRVVPGAALAPACAP